MAYPRTHNPFADEEEEEEQHRSSGGFDDPQERGMSEAERKQRFLQQEVMRTAKSAVEVIRQGEALKRTERMVDNMGKDLETIQKHINSIKSVWGGLVNYFKAKPETTKPPPEEPVAYQASSKLQNAMSHSKEHEDKYQASHPNLRKLKNLGLGLQSEIENQDTSLDNLLGKVDKMDLKINKTNQQIKNLK
ncbi:unnamed protein product [Coregonus sp. 'balchen']|nr:unnamed protein product [Coregonus sp. 'balchen']